MLGRLPVVRYGTTESGLDVSNPLDDPRSSDTVGIPLPGVLARIWAQEGGPQTHGEDGEIQISGTASLRGLLERPGCHRSRVQPGRLVSAPAIWGPWIRPPGTW